MNSTFFWMNENSIGILKNIILEVDFNIYDKKTSNSGCKWQF